MSSTQPNPNWFGLGWVGLGWVVLNLCDRLGWAEFFLSHYGGLGQKIPSTQSAHPYL